jgi:hypothetical protein
VRLAIFIFSRDVCDWLFPQDWAGDIDHKGEFGER